MSIILLFSTYVISALLLLLLRNKRRWMETVTVISVILESFMTWRIVAIVMLAGKYQYGIFEINSFSAYIAIINSIIGLAASFYSVGYLRGELRKKMIDNKIIWQLYIFLQMFLLSMSLALTSNYPMITWIAIEGTTLSTAYLVNFFRRPHDIEAAWKYLIICSFGLLMALLGTFLFTSFVPLSNQPTWSDLAANIRGINPILIKFAFIFIMIGYGTKMGIIPMHTWKPDAYHKSPIPITALLATALFNTTIFSILRFRNIVDLLIDPNFSKTIFLVFGILSLFVGSVTIYSQKNYKRLLAYSSVENGGLLLIAFGLGGMASIAGLLQILYHSLTKGLLFLLSGNIALKYSSSEIKDIKGMIKILPLTAILFIGAVLSLLGVPPFGIFLTELQIIINAFNMNPTLGAIILILLSFSFVGILRASFSMVYSEKPEGISEEKETNFWINFIPLIVFLLIILTSVYIPDFINTLIYNSFNLIK